MRGPRRTDADRRVRQCERLGRLLRLLHLIMGRGRWDADTLAEELCCSRRTVFRLFQTLSYAGVPWYFDEATKAYKVRPGFRFPGVINKTKHDVQIDLSHMKSTLGQLIQGGEEFLKMLKELESQLPETLNQK